MKNFIFNGTQKELEEFILQCDKYIDVPIAKWGDFEIVYNKLDGILQDYDGGWGDICPYFEVSPTFQDSLDDITRILCEMEAPKEFIDKVVELIYDCKLDTYPDELTEEEENEAIKINKEHVFELDSRKYIIR